MSSDNTDRVARVLRGALSVWEARASVERDPEGAIVVRAHSGIALRIVPAAPHGWLVFRDAHALGRDAGLTGLLRTLREELAPGAPAGRLIIGSQALR